MIRKIMFQIHLWSGLSVGLYVVLISLSGSLLVFRIEFYNYFRPGSTIAPSTADRLTADALKAAAKNLYPALEVKLVQLPRGRNRPVEVFLEGNGATVHRLFDPYTGEDLGEANPRAAKYFEKVAEFHNYLLGGQDGRFYNGVGGVILTIMSLTGLFIWWPGLKKLGRAMTVRRVSNWKRFNWDLHGAMGFWSFAFIFMWAFTSVYMIFPDPFLAFVDYVQPPQDDVPIRSGDIVLEWFARVHIGRFSGLWVKIIWGVFGLIPLALFVTCVIMWWNRKVRGWRRLEEGRLEQMRKRAYLSYVMGFFR
jgi:uncharacterized iron-regulated membrane protein